MNRLSRNRGRLLASIDLDNGASWLKTSGIDRIPPARLNCQNSDPQIEFACPAALTRCLGGTCMEIDVEVEGEGTIQVFWDLGTGWSAELSESRSLNVGGTDRQLVRVNLPPGVVGLRVDPLNRPGRITLHSIGFYAPEPAGARHFPFDAMRTEDRRVHSWIDLPEVQQIVSRRLMGETADDWPEWLFTRLIGERVRRCMHLGATDLSFGALAVESGYVDEYVAVQQSIEPDTNFNPSPVSNVQWLLPELAVQSGPFDLVLSTGYFSSGEHHRSPSELAAFAKASVVLLERFPLDPTAEAVLGRYLQSSAEALPPGWAHEQRRMLVEPGRCHLDERFRSMFDCHGLRPLGGTLVEPLFERLPREFFGLGAFTLLGALAATYLLLEETLILTGVLPSAWNLVTAVPRAGHPLKLLRPSPGWSVPATTTFDGTCVSAKEAIEAVAFRARLEEGALQRTGADAPSGAPDGSSWLRTTRAEMDRRARSYLRRTLRKLAREV